MLVKELSFKLPGPHIRQYGPSLKSFRHDVQSASSIRGGIWWDILVDHILPSFISMCSCGSIGLGSFRERSFLLMRVQGSPHGQSRRDRAPADDTAIARWFGQERKTPLLTEPLRQVADIILLLSPRFSQQCWDGIRMLHILKWSVCFYG